jgi:molybdate transport system substrate-binding protein
MRQVSLVGLALLGMLVGPAAQAAEITVLCSTGMQAALVALTPEYERTSGDRLRVTYQSSAPLKTAIDEGRAFDVAILTPGMIADLTKSGKVVEGSAATIARAGIGVAVRKGEPRPDITTEAAFKASFLAAASVASSIAGQSRVGLLAALDRLGITAEVNAKTKLIQTGSTGEAVARGEAALAVQLIPELQSVSGLDIVGPFPAGLQSYVVLTGGIARAAGDPARARALLTFLTSPDRAAVIKGTGMEPG